MERRELLMATGMIAAAATVGSAEAAQEHRKPGSTQTPLVDAALDCVKTGNACLDFCLRSLAEGDKMLGECARSVNELVTICDALVKLASMDSALLPKYAALTRESCERCEKKCRKHEGHHAVCKACADSCAACARECAKLA